MPEIRRFIRYTLPGIAISLQMFIALSVSDYDKVSASLKESGLYESIAFVFTALLASGGVGYLLSILFFAILWWSPIARLFAPDHRAFLITLSESDKIEIKKPDKEEPVIPTELKQRNAWLITTRYWHSILEVEKCLIGINPTIDRLTDIAHGLGATILGTAIIIPIWAVLRWPLYGFEILGIALWVAILFCMLFASYFPLQRSIQSMVNSSLVEVIINRNRENGKVTIWYCE